MVDILTVGFLKNRFQILDSFAVVIICDWECDELFAKVLAFVFLQCVNSA